MNGGYVMDGYNGVNEDNVEEGDNVVNGDNAGDGCDHSQG